MRKAGYGVNVGLILFGGTFICLTAAVRANTADDAMVGVNQGTISFEVATNVPALRVHGKSTSLAARARVGAGPDRFVLEQIEAIVPVRSLETGMALRDDHMRKYIFTTAAGDIPDVQFSGDRTECAKSDPRRATCTVSGALTIRGTAKPFAMTVTISEENGTIRAAGSGIVKLSAYGIEQPSQLGVRTTDDVKLKLELTVKRSSPAATSTTGAR
jgi:polyisoprenoid-binding protein YceI